MGSTVESESLCGLPGVTRDGPSGPSRFVDGFWMDATELTNEEFEKFVTATGYITIAERTPTKEEFPDAPPENLIAGSTVFTPTKNAVALDNYYQWWRYQPGASWRYPEGPQSTIRGKEKYPVLQMTYEDAVAYAKVGGEAAAHRSGMGICRARRTDRKALLVGRRLSVREISQWRTLTSESFRLKDTGADGSQGWRQSLHSLQMAMGFTALQRIALK